MSNVPNLDLILSYLETDLLFTADVQLVCDLSFPTSHVVWEMLLSTATNTYTVVSTA